MKQETTFFNNIKYSTKRKTTLGVIISVILLTATITTVIPTIQSAQAALDRFGGDVKAGTGAGTLSSLAELEPEEKTPKRVPIATSGDNVYLVWPDNKTGNWEIFFKASSDGGKTFGSKINLSNDTTRSADGSIAAEGNNVYVTWWNTNNQTGLREPVFKASEDNGKTFGERVMLSSNITAPGGR